jgi:hypothetical protein
VTKKVVGVFVRFRAPLAVEAAIAKCRVAYQRIVPSVIVTWAICFPSGLQEGELSLGLWLLELIFYLYWDYWHLQPIYQYLS